MHYLTLPSGVDVLPPSAEASSGPNACPRINHKTTKSPSAVLTWVHNNNGTIPPLQNTTWAHLLSHTLSISRKISTSSANPPWSWPTNRKPVKFRRPIFQIKHKVRKSPSVIPTWFHRYALIPLKSMNADRKADMFELSRGQVDIQKEPALRFCMSRLPDCSCEIWCCIFVSE